MKTGVRWAWLSPPVRFLLPENPEYEPIRIDLKDQPLVIEGLAVGVLRKEI